MLVWRPNLVRKSNPVEDIDKWPGGEEQDSLKNILPRDGEVFYLPDVFSPVESAQHLAALLREVKWKQEPIVMFGKKVLQPRLTAWVGDPDKPYRYSSITMQPQPWTDSLLEIRRRVESLANVQFTSALLNFYRDGQDSMGWHRDNEKELGAEPVIGSVSFGATRRFQLRHYYKKELRREVELAAGSFLVMRGKSQQFWEHRLPKTTPVTEPRINITFRVIVGERKSPARE